MSSPTIQKFGLLGGVTRPGPPPEPGPYPDTDASLNNHKSVDEGTYPVLDLGLSASMFGTTSSGSCTTMSALMINLWFDLAILMYMLGMITVGVFVGILGAYSIHVDTITHPTDMSKSTSSFIILSSILWSSTASVNSSIGVVIMSMCLVMWDHDCTTTSKLRDVHTRTQWYSRTMSNTEEYTHPHSDLVAGDGLVYFRDDFPLWGALANELPPEERAIIEQLEPRRAVVNDGLMYFVYCRGLASWAQLYSEAASSELLRITGINAPVNYSKALKSTYMVCKRIAFPIAKVYPSVCIGTYRLMFKIEYKDEGPVVMYTPHHAVIDRGTRHESTDRISCFVVNPIVMPNPVICPYIVNVDFNDVILNKIMAPLRDDQKHDFLWRMGKAFVEPEGNVIIFYGRDGQEGKTKFITTITRMLTNAIEWVAEDLIGKDSKWPDADTIMYLCDKRFLVCDETNIADGMSYNNIKRWTSGAPVSMNGRTGFLAHTIFVMSNAIPFAERAAINNSIGRRVTIYHMDKLMSKYTPLDRSEITNTIVVKFISMCLSVYWSSRDDPSTSLAIAMYTLFRKNINKYTADIVYDVGSSKWECLAATSAMATNCNVPMSRLVSAFHAISPRLVHMPEYGKPYIRSVRRLRTTLTDHGIEVRDKRREANIPIITMESIMDRMYLMRDL